MQIKNHESLEYKDIKLVPKKSILNSREDANISAQLGKHTFKVPVCAANMKSILTPEICKTFDARGWRYTYHRLNGADDVFLFARKAEREFNFVSISIGISEEWIGLLNSIKASRVRIDSLLIDVAHCWNDNILHTLDWARTCCPDAFITVGNTSSPECVEWLESLGVDCVRIGQGISSSCRTYQFCGFGSTSVGSLIDCASVAKNIKIMSDGGITHQGTDIWIGDIAKAIRFGADWVTSGVLFSKCIDSPAILNGYAGNASAEMRGHRKNVEGTSLKIETNGLYISEMMDLVEDSLRSSVSYAGGKDLSALKTVDFIDMRKF